MGAGTALALLSLAVLALSGRAPRPLLTAGGVAVRAVLLLTPPAARNAMALLNCASAAVSPAGCASLNGCSSSGAESRGSSVAVSLLASNSYYVCWAPGGAHNAAGGLAAATLAVAVVAFPIAFLWAVFQQQRAGRPQQQQRGMPASRVADDKGLEASVVVINPLRLGAATAALESTAVPAEGWKTEVAPLLAPFLADYRPDAWYTRHADLALTLLLAALQVRRGKSAAYLSHAIFRVWPCRLSYRPLRPKRLSLARQRQSLRRRWRSLRTPYGCAPLPPHKRGRAQ